MISTQVTLKAAESLAGWILEDKDGDWGEAFGLCSDALPKLAKVLGAQLCGNRPCVGCTR